MKLKAYTSFKDDYQCALIPLIGISKDSMIIHFLFWGVNISWSN